MKILIAEDDDISRLILVKKLTAMGYEPIPATDGESAWNSFLINRPRIVITDWMMPNVDGLELCRRLRSLDHEKYTYVIFLTALAGEDYYLEGMDAGADDFLNKPVNMNELIARLRVAERILDIHTKVTQLEGLLPICSYCKKIRDDENNWQPIEGYIKERSEATFSHGCCPSCREKYVRPELEEIRRRKEARG